MATANIAEILYMHISTWCQNQQTFCKPVWSLTTIVWFGNLILANFRNFSLRTMILKIEKWTKRFGKLQTLHMVFSIQESDWVQIDGVAGFVITAYSIHTNECYLILVFLCLKLAFRPWKVILLTFCDPPRQGSLCVEVFPESLSRLVLFLSQKLWNLIWDIISQIRNYDSHLDNYFRSEMWTKLAVATLLLAALLVMKPDLFSRYYFFS